MVEHPFDKINQLSLTLKLGNNLSPSILKYQEQITRLHEILHPITFEAHRQNLEIANSITPLVASIQSIQNRISPIIEIIAEQQTYMQRALIQAEAFQHIKKIHLAIENALDSPYTGEALENQVNKIEVLDRIVADVTQLVNEHKIDAKEVEDNNLVRYKVVEIKTLDWINITLQIIAILITVIISYPNLKDNVSLILQDLTAAFQLDNIPSTADTNKPTD